MADEMNVKDAAAQPIPQSGASREMTLREYIEHTLPASHRARKELDRAMRALCDYAMGWIVELMSVQRLASESPQFTDQ